MHLTVDYKSCGFKQLISPFLSNYRDDSLAFSQPCWLTLHSLSFVLVLTFFTGSSLIVSWLLRLG